MERPTDFPKIGEQHPDGSRMSPVTKTQKDTLNFGWFSLPSAKKGRDSGEDGPNSPVADSGLHEDCTSPENDKRPTSKEGSRPDSQQRSPSAREPANRCEVEQPGYEQQDHAYSQKCQNQPGPPAQNENIMLDWPISALAGDRILQHSSTEASVQRRTPMAKSEAQVPPTPVPPLCWQGYQNCSRPTYATWQSLLPDNRDQYAQNQGRNINNSNVGKDANKKSGSSVSKNREKKANKSRDKNSNNNNDVEQSGAKNQCSSNKSLLSVSNYSADGNNNNWLLGETEQGVSPAKHVRTLPPYEYSSGEASPTFYSPNVVMKWEDTEQQSKSTQDKQSFKHTSLMKRIRSSLFQMWSLVPCMKHQEEERTTPRSRLFKYDRFDHEKTLKKHTQGSWGHD